MRHALALILISACGVGEPSDDTGAMPSMVDPGMVSPGMPRDPASMFLAQPTTCSTGGWCWHNRAPNGSSYNDTFSTSDDNVWVANDLGVSQWNGREWIRHAMPAPPFAAPPEYHPSFGMFAGTGPDDMWACNPSMLVHWDGHAWTVRDSIPFDVDQRFTTRPWIAPNGDVWVGMDYGIVDRSIGGGTFKETDTGILTDHGGSEFSSIWGTSANDVWLVGRPGVIAHYAQGGFVQDPFDAWGSTLDFIQGSGADDIWTGGMNGMLAHYDGTAWTKIDSGTTQRITHIMPALRGDLTFMTEPSVVGSEPRINGLLMDWNGTSITSTPIDLPMFIGGQARVNGTWWIAGSTSVGGGLFSLAPDTGIATPIVAPDWSEYAAIWGTADDNVYVTAGNIQHWDGATWSEIGGDANGIPFVNTLAGVHAETFDELWAVGFELDGDRQPLTYLSDIYHYDDYQYPNFPYEPPHWSRVVFEESITSVWPMGRNEAMLVGKNGTVYHYQDFLFHQIATTTTADLVGAWGPDRDHVWIIGTGGTILAWDRAAPTTLTAQASPLTLDLRAIHGAGGVAWVVPSWMSDDGSGGGYVLRNAGAGWETVSIPTSPGTGLDVSTVFAKSADEVLFGGSHRALYRYAHGTVTLEDNGVDTSYLAGLFAAPGGHEWSIAPGAILQHAP